MENLLEETLRELQKNNKSIKDIKWVGGGTLWMTWDTFASNSNFSYDDGFGGQEIASNLMVVGDDWWLERGEYDGSEWWEFKSLPAKPPKEATGPLSLKAHIGWETIDELNG